MSRPFHTNSLNFSLKIAIFWGTHISGDMIPLIYLSGQSNFLTSLSNLFLHNFLLCPYKDDYLGIIYSLLSILSISLTHVYTIIISPLMLVVVDYLSSLSSLLRFLKSVLGLLFVPFQFSQYDFFKFKFWFVGMRTT